MLFRADRAVGIWALFLDWYDVAQTADASHSAWNTGIAAFLTGLSYLIIA